MGWPLWSTVVPCLLDLLRYQHHHFWNTPEWEPIFHSLHHLYHLHCRLEPCSEIHLSIRGLPKLADSQALGEEVPFFYPSSFTASFSSRFAHTSRFTIPSTSYLSDTPKPSRLSIFHPSIKLQLDSTISLSFLLVQIYCLESWISICG